jgi:hypothetical protein
MTEPSLVKLDNGAANQRILAKEASADYRRVEQASIKQRTRLESPEAKRLFVRFFHTLQLNAHFVSEIARTRLTPEEVEKVEGAIKARLDALAKEVDASIDGAAALFEREVLTTAASYDTQPLDMDVPLISSFGRRYLEVLQKFDRLMPMLKTLEIYEVVSIAQADKRRAVLKRQVRDVASAARRLANGLRRRMNEQQARAGMATPGLRSENALRGEEAASSPVATVNQDNGTSPDEAPLGAGAGRDGLGGDALLLAAKAATNPGCDSAEGAAQFDAAHMSAADLAG